MNLCTCGHPKGDHFVDHCERCSKSIWRCDCPEDADAFFFDGCDAGFCYCDGFTAAKPPAPEPADPNQIALFGGDQ